MKNINFDFYYEERTFDLKVLDDATNKMVATGKVASYLQPIIRYNNIEVPIKAVFKQDKKTLLTIIDLINTLKEGE